MPLVAEILTMLENQVLSISFNRAEKMNALTRGMYGELAAELNSADKEFGIRAVIITSEGNHFTGGNDITDFLDYPPTAQDSTVAAFLASIHNFSKPLIIAVKGNAVGIGTTMLLHADIVVSSESAKFSLPFTSLGLVPEAGSTFLLPRMIGHHRAAELFMTGETFAADFAQEIGIVNYVVSDPIEPYEKAREIALKIAKQPPQAIINTKALMKANVHDAVSAVMKAEFEIFALSLQSEEARNAFMQFLSRKREK
jgi:enoyl-CoA hydratase/carnithine racemase